MVEVARSFLGGLRTLMAFELVELVELVGWGDHVKQLEKKQTRRVDLRRQGK